MIIGGGSNERVRIDIGDPPSPDLHQRVYECRPQKQVDGEPVKFPREKATRWTFESTQDWSDFAGSDRGSLLADGKRKVIELRESAAVNEPSPQIIFDAFNTDGITGNRWTVTGRIQPLLQVEPRKY